MRWRAVRKAGAQAPALAAETGDYVPEPTGSKNSVIIVSQSSGKEYRVDVMDPLNVGDPIKLLRRRGKDFYIEAGTLWGDMFPYGTFDPTFGSPPFRGSQNQLGSALDPPADRYPNKYGWENAGASPPEGMTAEAVTSELWTRNFDDNVSGGTNLWDIALEEIRLYVNTSKVFLGYGAGVVFDIKSTGPLRIRVSISIKSISDDPFIPKVPESYYKGELGYKYWTPEGISDPACWESLSYIFSIGTTHYRKIYFGYGDKAGKPTEYYGSGDTGFVKYGKPRMYLILLPDKTFRTASYVVNNQNNGNNSSQWPHIDRTGVNCDVAGIELLPGIPGHVPDPGAGREQYRIKGWAVNKS